MPTGIDHLVVAVPDPDAAADELERELGIVFPSGGRHPGAGTFNRIAFLGEPYLELIGIDDPEAAKRSPIGAAALRTLEAEPAGGFATFALLDDDLEATVDALRQRGSEIGVARSGSRRTPHGELVEWWTATFETLGPEQPPFLIRHVRTGSEWSDEAVERRWTLPQPLGCVVTLAMLEVSLLQPDLVARRYRSQLGLAASAVGDDRLVLVGPHTILLRPAVSEQPGVGILMACPDQQPRSVDRFGVRFQVTPPSTS
jgi:catechol 2,3-dioxygenase-like lactoylglutathione lyase family enzyme